MNNTTNNSTTPTPAQGHPNTGDLAALFDASREVFEPAVINVPRANAEEFPALVLSKAMQAVDITAWMDQHREFPKRAEGQSEHETMDSLVAHVVRTADKNTAAWLQAAGTSAELTVVYDYHLAHDARREKGDGSKFAGEDGVARWCKRKAHHTFPISKEWQAWKAVSGQPLTQAGFAAFIEEHVAELRGPDSASGRVMEIATLLAQGDEAYHESMGAESLRDLAMRRIGTPSQLVKMARRIALTLDLRAEESRDESGNVSVVYRAEAAAEDTSTKGEVRSKVALPSLLVIEVPVLEGGQLYRLPVRLTTKIANQKATWVLSLHRSEAAFADAVKDAAETFTRVTGVPVFRGKAE